MAEFDRRAGFGPLSALQRERVHNVIASTADIECRTIRRPHDAVEGLSVVRQKDDLRLHRRIGRGDVIHENKLTGIRPGVVAAGVLHQVVAAGQDQQSFAIRANGRGLGAIRRIHRKVRQ